MEHMFNAYFSQGKFLNDKKVLLECVEKAGLDKNLASEEVLDNKSEKYSLLL